MYSVVLSKVKFYCLIHPSGDSSRQAAASRHSSCSELQGQKALVPQKPNLFESANPPYNLPTPLKIQNLPISNTTKRPSPAVETLHSFLCSAILFHALHLNRFSQGRAHHNIPLNTLQPSENFFRGPFFDQGFFFSDLRPRHSTPCPRLQLSPSS